MKNILVIDDDSMVQNLFDFSLATNNIDIKHILNGFDAKFALFEKKYDAIFLDINIPGTSGKMLLNSIKKSQTCVNKDTPVIMISSSKKRKDIQQCFQNGAENYLIKPIRANSIVENINYFSTQNYKSA